MTYFLDAREGVLPLTLYFTLRENSDKILCGDSIGPAHIDVPKRILRPTQRSEYPLCETRAPRRTRLEGEEGS